MYNLPPPDGHGDTALLRGAKKSAKHGVEVAVWQMPSMKSFIDDITVLTKDVSAANWILASKSKKCRSISLETVKTRYCISMRL